MSEQEWGEEVDMLNVVCPDCAFSYCHVHTDADGGYSCPLCAEAALTAERDTLRGVLERMAEYTWDGNDLDGGTFEDLMIEVGLMVEVPASDEIREEYDTDVMYQLAWRVKP